VEDELGVALNWLGDIEPAGIRFWEKLAQRRPELPTRPGYEDFLSRSERIGD